MATHPGGAAAATPTHANYMMIKVGSLLRQTYLPSEFSVSGSPPTSVKVVLPPEFDGPGSSLFTQLTATIVRASLSGGTLAGIVTFQFNGAPAAGVSVPVSMTAGATTSAVTTTVPLDHGVIPGGAGVYPLAATFASTTTNYGAASLSTSVAVAPETGGLAWTGDYGGWTPTAVCCLSMSASRLAIRD